ncbi:MAG: outer membrane lipoprotein-sorting protein [Thermodesulfobacteriota bacterium]|nr:outer membrane lipoprotein-sorting protein [Thermodesulfobacteriota bacterium]
MEKAFFMGTIMFVVAIAPLAFAVDGNDLLKKVDRNLNPESFEMYRKLMNIEPDGSRKEFVMYSVKKGVDKVASVFLSPASEKGRSTLRVGENMWLYIPNVGKPIRITSLQSVTGGVFNNSDILRLDYSAEYNVERLEKIDEGILLYLKAKTRAVAYDTVKMWVDDKRLLPTKIECYASSGMLLKILYFKEVKDFKGGIVRPAVVETESPHYKGYKSIMVFAKIRARELNEEVFTLTFMPNLGTLR